MNTPINTFKTLDDIFDVEATPVETLIPVAVETTSQLLITSTKDNKHNFPSVDDLMDDYQKSRSTLRNVLDKGEHALTNMMQIAVQTESARSFEVVSNLMKTMSEISKDLISLHKQVNDSKKKDIDDSKTPQPQLINNTQNNIVFQGTTTDLFDMISSDQQ